MGWDSQMSAYMRGSISQTMKCVFVIKTLCLNFDLLQGCRPATFTVLTPTHTQECWCPATPTPWCFQTEAWTTLPWECPVRRHRRGSSSCDAAPRHNCSIFTVSAAVHVIWIASAHVHRKWFSHLNSDLMTSAHTDTDCLKLPVTSSNVWVKTLCSLILHTPMQDCSVGTAAFILDFGKTRLPAGQVSQPAPRRNFCLRNGRKIVQDY